MTRIPVIADMEVVVGDTSEMVRSAQAEVAIHQLTAAQVAQAEDVYHQTSVAGDLVVVDPVPMLVVEAVDIQAVVAASTEIQARADCVKVVVEGLIIPE
jgi:hypothetical protein